MPGPLDKDQSLVFYCRDCSIRFDDQLTADLHETTTAHKMWAIWTFRWIAVASQGSKPIQPDVN